MVLEHGVAWIDEVGLVGEEWVGEVEYSLGELKLVELKQHRWSERDSFLLSSSALALAQRRHLQPCLSISSCEIVSRRGNHYA